ncbi:efflux RND transporter periplasmic adaptor subunit [Aequorivita sp. H23M31]|uniref:Efflux RND transporter periplasmic adaptor subunit n=1 Tax=Aequorivita ciconiae TaxID=2494375 RepID=A0A410G725_9FLAO|nr:efflux RND transporter periplasmic adaptor subunit [Aequorivita sp. H23M31]QAA82975.1 efflux RND transporter periplasmic adaptor subunit [Aequorivita sp. H23M31]
MKITQKLTVAALLVFTLTGCGNDSEEFEFENQNYCLDEKFKDKVAIQTVTLQPVTEGIHLTGSVETNPDKVVHFVSLVGGIISKTYFSLGDKVSKGQLLAELQSTELSGLESELKNLNAQIQVSEKRLQSAQSMFQDGIASEADLMQAQTELDIHKSERQKIISNLNIYSASTERGVFQIKAPVSGIITSKSIASGTQITAEGEPLFTISDLREVWIMVDIYATNVQNIDSGMDVNINTLSYPDTEFKGKIDAVSQVLDSDAKVVKARVVMENTDLKLKPGMLVDVVALRDRDMEAIGIPTEALVFDDNQNFVIVHKSDCDMKIKKVEILFSNNGLTFLKSGLEENENIITKNPLLIYEQINN